MTSRRERADWKLSEEAYGVLARATAKEKEDRQRSIGEFYDQWGEAIEEAK